MCLQLCICSISNMARYFTPPICDVGGLYHVLHVKLQNSLNNNFNYCEIYYGKGILSYQQSNVQNNDAESWWHQNPHRSLEFCGFSFILVVCFVIRGVWIFARPLLYCMELFNSLCSMVVMVTLSDCQATCFSDLLYQSCRLMWRNYLI